MSDVRQITGQCLAGIALALVASTANAHGIGFIAPTLITGSLVIGVVTGAIAARLETRFSTALMIGLAVLTVLVVVGIAVDYVPVQTLSLVIIVLNVLLPWAVVHGLTQVVLTPKKDWRN